MIESLSMDGEGGMGKRGRETIMTHEEISRGGRYGYYINAVMVSWVPTYAKS